MEARRRMGISSIRGEPVAAWGSAASVEDLSRTGISFDHAGSGPLSELGGGPLAKLGLSPVQIPPRSYEARPLARSPARPLGVHPLPHSAPTPLEPGPTRPGFAPLPHSALGRPTPLSTRPRLASPPSFSTPHTEPGTPVCGSAPPVQGDVHEQCAVVRARQVEETGLRRREVVAQQDVVDLGSERGGST